MVQTGDVESFLSVMFRQGLLREDELTRILRRLGFQARGLYTDLDEERVMVCFEGLPLHEDLTRKAVKSGILGCDPKDQLQWLQHELAQGT